MQWFDDDPDALPSERMQLLALDELISDLAVQMGRYAPRSEALVGLWTFTGRAMTHQTIFSYRGDDCTPVTFNRARLRGSVERLQDALAIDSDREARAVKVGINVEQNDFAMEVAYTPDDAVDYTVTAANWRERAARHDPRGRYTGKAAWWKRSGPEPEAFRPTAERFLEAWTGHRSAQRAAGQETIGMAALDDGASSTAIVAYDKGERRDIHPDADDACVLLGYNLLDEDDGTRPAALLTYAAPGRPPQYQLFHGDAALPWLVTRTRHDVLAPKVRTLFA